MTVRRTQAIRPERVAVTDLLRAWEEGDDSARDALVPLLYDELREIAEIQLRRERPGHILQTTALVHEAYLRLLGQERAHWQNRAQFLGVVAQMMRRILVDWARRARAQKRGGEMLRITLDEELIALDSGVDLLDVDDALRQLEELDARKARVVELRFFGGLDVAAIAQVLDISSATVGREWRKARAWLYDRLMSQPEG